MTVPLRIALLGTRGIPASYSGFETCVEQLGQRLVERGHQVTVYGRSHHITYSKAVYKGMRLVILPTIANKYLDTLVHTFISTFHALPRRYDVALYFIAANSPAVWLPRLVGTRTALNVDGLDWKRAKWPRFAKWYIQFAEWLATWLPNAFVTDSRVVQTYYRNRFHREPPFIPYGSEVDPLPPGRFLEQFGLKPREYILFVGRLVPENCAHHLVSAFKSLVTDKKCVVVGDAPYAGAYIAELKASASANVVFTGYLFGEGYRELSSNAYAFVETSGVGGTHPALIEAMAFGNCVVVHDTPENLETIGPDGLSYDGRAGPDDLGRVLTQLVASRDLAESYGTRARARARALYCWDQVTDEYERLFYRLKQIPLPARLT